MLARFACAAVAVACVACGQSAGGGADDDGAGAASGSTGSGSVAPPKACGDVADRSGEATYYDFADGGGNCSFDPTPDDLRVGAMNHVDYAESAVCGACARIVGPSGEVTVRLVDQCPECPEGDIDLSPEAFSQIADLELGRVPITWQYAPCEVSGPIRYHFKEGSNQWWTAVQVRNHRFAIATFEFVDGDGAYQSVPRESYNYFVAESGMGPGPYTFRVTDVHGQTLEDTGVPFVEAGDSPGASQFGECQ